MKILKLYVWDGVFCDYTCGIAFAVAYTKNQAIKAVIANSGTWVKDELENVEPVIIKLNTEIEPIGWQVSGGG